MQFEDFCKRGDHQRLGEAGQPDHETVAACGDGDEQFLRDLLLADDDATELGKNARGDFPDGLDILWIDVRCVRERDAFGSGCRSDGDFIAWLEADDDLSELNIASRFQQATLRILSIDDDAVLAAEVVQFPCS